MVTLPEELELALMADDADRLNLIIAQANPDHFDLLKALVQDDDTSTMYRRRALTALGRWLTRSDEAVNTISSTLPNLNELERITAVHALGSIGSEEALNSVLICTQDDAPDVRLQAVKALDKIGTSRATQVLGDMAATEKVDYVREIAQQLKNK